MTCESAIQTQQEEKDLETTNLSELIEQPLTHYNGKSYSEKTVVQHQERLINDLYEIYEGFGGIWRDPDDQEHIYIALTEQERRNVNHDVVVRELTTTVTERFMPNNIPNAKKPKYRFTVKEVTYTIRELQHFRDLLSPSLHPREGVVYSYIDNSENQFIIGILDTSEKSEYSPLLATHSIPKDAVRFVKTGSANSFMGAATQIVIGDPPPPPQFNNTLQDLHRPLTGGFKIERSDGFACTMGFNVELDGEKMWVTHSFCSDQFSNTGNTVFYQEEIGNSADIVGTEFRDFSSTVEIRSSVGVLIDAEFPGDVNFGKIARTEDIATGWGNSGSIELNDGSDPPFVQEPEYFDIVAEQRDNIIEGTDLNKVGQATGRTRGAIVSTCLSVNPVFDTSWTLDCQILSQTYGESGDRGAPAFFQISFADDVELVGILAGGISGTQQTYYSPMEGIRDDLVNFDKTMIIYPGQ